MTISKNESLITCKLNALIIYKQLKSLESGNKVKIRDIEDDIAESCDISRDMVISIKAGRTTPSLPVALKIAKYFELPVNKIFELKENLNNYDESNSTTENAESNNRS